jgi:hypothetical protein
MKLTAAQRRILETARDHGHALARTGMGSRAGGSIARMCDRLTALGLLTTPPHQLTNAGRAALAPSAVEPT